MKNTLKHAIFTILILSSAISGGCGREKSYRIAEGVAWHTTYHITYRSDIDLSGAIIQTMDSVEQSLSPFLDTSVITAVNRNICDTIDRRIAIVFEKSKKINALSNGAFDPTLAPLINLWGFGYTDGTPAPSQAMIDSCMATVGIEECYIDGNRLIKKSPDTEFNFSAITKGFGCDEVARTLRANGCENFLIEIGGEISASGESGRGTKWKVMVDSPVDSIPGATGGMAVINVSDCGIATSGNYRNYHDTDRGRISHTISATTGFPVESEILSATVIAPTTMEADALATASMAMPLQDAITMFGILGKSYGALFIIAKDGKWETIETESFRDLTH